MNHSDNYQNCKRGVLPSLLLCLLLVGTRPLSAESKKAVDSACKISAPEFSDFQKHRYQLNNGRTFFAFQFHRIIDIEAKRWACLLSREGVIYASENDIVSKAYISSDLDGLPEFDYKTSNHLPLILSNDLAVKATYARVISASQKIAPSATGFSLGYWFETPYFFRSYDFIRFEIEAGLSIYQPGVETSITNYLQAITRINVHFPFYTLKKINFSLVAATGIIYEQLKDELFLYESVFSTIGAGIMAMWNFTNLYQIGFQILFRDDLTQEISDQKIESQVILKYAFFN